MECMSQFNLSLFHSFHMVVMRCTLCRWVCICCTESNMCTPGTWICTPGSWICTNGSRESRLKSSQKGFFTAQHLFLQLAFKHMPCHVHTKNKLMKYQSLWGVGKNFDSMKNLLIDRKLCSIWNCFFESYPHLKENLHIYPMCPSTFWTVLWKFQFSQFLCS